MHKDVDVDVDVHVNVVGHIKVVALYKWLAGWLAILRRKLLSQGEISLAHLMLMVVVVVVVVVVEAEIRLRGHHHHHHHHCHQHLASCLSRAPVCSIRFD